MTLNLSDLTFTNDFAEVSLPDGSTLTVNQINEDFLTDDTETVIDRYNFVVTTEDSSYICSSVIGVANDWFVLKSDYADYQGKVLTSGNIDYCYLEIYENE